MNASTKFSVSVWIAAVAFLVTPFLASPSAHARENRENPCKGTSQERAFADLNRQYTDLERKFERLDAKRGTPVGDAIGANPERGRLENAQNDLRTSFLLVKFNCTREARSNLGAEVANTGSKADRGGIAGGIDNQLRAAEGK